MTDSVLKYYFELANYEVGNSLFGTPVLFKTKKYVEIFIEVF